ncbi:MAG: PD-(D/E)XK nuclease family protein, partial [Cyanobacteria bacterium P01_H01_bin.58]
MLRLSQGQLTLLEYCPRRFQHTVLESLSVP